MIRTSIFVFAALTVTSQLSQSEVKKLPEFLFSPEYKEDAKFDGEYIKLISKTWSVHHANKLNRKLGPEAFDVFLHKKDGYFRVHFVPKFMKLGQPRRGTECMYIFSSTGKLLTPIVFG